MLKGYLIVDKAVLPDFFSKVVEARQLLESGKFGQVSEAVKEVGISRSTYYKYKDHILEPTDLTVGRKAVLSMLLSHEAGALSKVLGTISGSWSQRIDHYPVAAHQRQGFGNGVAGSAERYRRH